MTERQNDGKKGRQREIKADIRQKDRKTEIEKNKIS